VRRINNRWYLVLARGLVRVQYPSFASALAALPLWTLPSSLSAVYDAAAVTRALEDSFAGAVR
jgi:hypothetical protein